VEKLRHPKEGHFDSLIAPTPAFRPAHPIKIGGPTLVLCLLGSARPRGNIESVLQLGELLRMLEWKLRMRKCFHHGKEFHPQVSPLCVT